MQTYKLALFVYLGTVFAAAEVCDNNNVCKHTKIHGMWTADCYNRTFKKFPRCLRRDVEIIDASFNRLRKITKEDISKYSNLKILYLSDNLLSRLDNNVLEDKDELQSLDLSLNALSTLPSVIFQLPSLKRLYLSQNLNANIAELIDEVKPISSPLELLDLSFNEIETLPDLGVMPHLIAYNISGNDVSNPEVRHFSGLCKLKFLYNSNFTSYFDDPCQCWNVQRWLMDRNVMFNKWECGRNVENCPYNVSEQLRTYETCMQLSSKLEFQSNLSKYALPAGLAALLVLVLLAYSYNKQRKRKRRLRRKLALEMKSEKDSKKGAIL